MSIKNGDVINLDVYEQDNLSNKTVIITEDISDIVLTSNGKPCDFRIFVKKRSSDLNIDINNLVINSKREIAINFSAGKEHEYKSYLTFSGINVISSEENIAICVTNNQTVEIKGKKDSFLKIIGGSGVPAIGSSFYTEGAGNIVFSGEGSVEVIVNGNNLNNRETLNSGCGIGFYSENMEDVSSIKILDNINLKIVGEDGIDIESISQDKIAGRGGDGVWIKNIGVFEKIGKGILEINGGNGGGLIGDYSAGICGDGGCSISLGQGNINIDNKAILRAGNGGGIKDEYEFPMIKGGNGGDVIYISENNLESISEIRLGNDIEFNLGNGGNSGSFIEGKDIKGFDGGNSGSLINSNAEVVRIEIGDINIKEGMGGLGGNKNNKSSSGQDGRVKELYLGNNVEFVKLKEESHQYVDKIENKEVLEEIVDLKIVNDSEKDDYEEEKPNNLDVENNDDINEYTNIVENINKNTELNDISEENNDNIKEVLEESINNRIIDENIIDIEKSDMTKEVLEDNKRGVQGSKKSIWEKIKKFFSE